MTEEAFRPAQHIVESVSRPGDDCDEDHDDKNYEDDYDDDGDNDDGGDDYEDDEDDGGGGVQNKSLHTKSQTIFFGRLIITIDSKNYLGFNDHIKQINFSYPNSKNSPIHVQLLLLPESKHSFSIYVFPNAIDSTVWNQSSHVFDCYLFI